MKRTAILLVTILCCAAASAQQPDIYENLRQNQELLCGTDYLCPTTPVELTAAPDGYEAFYISHYGRHGARYAWQGDLYSSINDLLAKAEGEDNLTELGKSFKERFDKLYPDVKYRVGDLSDKGWDQQHGLAKLMYGNYPEVFEDGADVNAYTSTSTRCIMTMSSFCVGLKGENPKLNVKENFGYSFLPAILPLDSHNPFRKDDYELTPNKVKETYPEYIARKIDSGKILSRIFKDVEKDVPAEKQWDLVSYLYFFVNGMASLYTELDFTDIFTLEDRIALWETDCFQFYTLAWNTHMGYLPIVEDIIAKADAQIASGRKGADLRFGHDYTILPLLMILGVDGYDHECTTGDEIPFWCPVNRVPMGANLHFVFFRSKDGSDILFKVLFNREEAHLPIYTENWPYYSWNSFKAKFGGLYVGGL